MSSKLPKPGDPADHPSLVNETDESGSGSIVMARAAGVSPALAVVQPPGIQDSGVPPVIESKESSRLDMKYLVRALVKYNASDLHIKVGRPPLFRINGKLMAAKMEKLNPEQVQRVIYGVLSERQIRDLEEKLQIDFSFRVGELGRFRCNVFFQRGHVAAVIRMIPFTVPQFDDLNLPAVIKELCIRPRGLLLVTGATGSGKSTTLASMIQYLNENRHVHVLALEDPIEFIFRDMKASITQREIGSDAHSFEEALYAGLRQDPDVIVLGELREPELIQTALTAAETGHLVMATLHTNDARSTVDRIIDVFPAEAKNQIRIQLASTLLGVVAQQLIRRADGNGRIPACEIMIKSPTIENLIMKNEIPKIPDAIESSNNYYKMQTLNQDLRRMVDTGLITADEALKASNNPDNLRLALSGVARELAYD